MKCKVHPEIRAIGACVSCGRLICSHCKVTFEGKPHCKSCIEAGNYYKKREAQQYETYPEYTPTEPYPAQDVYTPQDQYSTQGAYQEQTAIPMPGEVIPEWGQTDTSGTYYEAQPSSSVYSSAPDSTAQPYVYPTPKVRNPGSGTMFFIAGAGGAVIAGIGTIACAIFFFISTFYFYDFTYSDPTYFAILSGSVLCIGMAIVMIGFYGFYLNFRWQSCIQCGGILLVGGVFFFIIMPLSIRVDQFGRYSMDTLTLYLSELTLGVSFIIGGISIARLRRYTYAKDLPLATGLVMTIGGILFCGFIGVFIIGWVIVSISLMMLAVFFMHAARTPGRYVTKKIKPAPTIQYAYTEKSPYPSTVPTPTARVTPTPSRTIYTESQPSSYERFKPSYGSTVGADSSGIPQPKMEKYPYLRSTESKNKSSSEFRPQPVQPMEMPTIEPDKYPYMRWDRKRKKEEKK